MKLTPEVIRQLEKDLSQAKTYEDLMGRDRNSSFDPVVIKKKVRSKAAYMCLAKI